jgi:hypothetical protein
LNKVSLRLASVVERFPCGSNRLPLGNGDNHGAHPDDRARFSLWRWLKGDGYLLDAASGVALHLAKVVSIAYQFAVRSGQGGEGQR